MVRVISIEDGLTWHPVEPKPMLVVQGVEAELALTPSPDDEDQRLIVISWSGVRLATIGYPNDEGIPEHRLYSFGLDRLIWMGEVLDGENTAEGIRHFVLPTKEDLIEVHARSYSIDRVDGTPNAVRDASASGRERYAALLDRLAE